MFKEYYERKAKQCDAQELEAAERGRDAEARKWRKEAERYREGARNVSKNTLPR